ncbi:hypothetical protein AX17_005037 [Amanita inopinata Kibby_2008]|nr:hypothetical protein AX17_005037 [Amanita inopinata Kibby_2008]
MSCTESVVAVTVSVQAASLTLMPPQNQAELTGFATRFASQRSNVTEEAGVSQMYDLNAQYDIWTKLCVPQGFNNGTLQFAIHGINFDHSYWEFGGDGSQYNYVDMAVAAGHAIFIYDRLGVGQSSKPDGINEVQRSTEIGVATELLKFLKRGSTGLTFSKVIAIGHSFGSSQVVGLTANHADLVDAIVLTGFSSYAGGMLTAFSTFGLTIASLQNPERFGTLPSSYLATEGIFNDQTNFFRYPAFEFSVLKLASDTKGTLTVGELATQSAQPAQSFDKPVFIVTGDKDFIFCAGDCYQTALGASNLIMGTKVYRNGLGSCHDF